MPGVSSGPVFSLVSIDRVCRMRMLRSAVLVCLAGCLVVGGAGGVEDAPNPKAMSPPGPEVLIAMEGYPAETHMVHTSDGYILQVHRIPNKGKPVVYLQHGILSSAADWVLLGRGKSLAYILHDAGYDVWMGNARGTTYSRLHERWTDSDFDFWDFSWHQIGAIDVPTTIDHVLNITGQPNLFYVGHSQGTTSFFVMTSTRPEYNAKVRAMFALAPVAFLEYVRSQPVKLLATLTNQLALLSYMVGLNEFLPNSGFITKLSGLLCQDNSLTQQLCTNSLFLFTGFDSVQLNTTTLPRILQYIPAGSSTKQFIHFGQLVKGKKFRHFDYGFTLNKRTYGVHPPPEYNLTAVTTPVHLHFSDNDLLGTSEGAQDLRNSLPNVPVFRRVPYAMFNHMDFLYAKDGVQLVYNSVLEGMKQHEQKGVDSF